MEGGLEKACCIRQRGIGVVVGRTYLMNCKSSFALVKAGSSIRFYTPHCPWSIILSFPRRPSTPLTLLLLLSDIPPSLALFCIIIPRICSSTGWTSFLFRDTWITYPNFEKRRQQQIHSDIDDIHVCNTPSLSLISYTSLVYSVSLPLLHFCFV